MKLRDCFPTTSSCYYAQEEEDVLLNAIHDKENKRSVLPAAEEGPFDAFGAYFSAVMQTSYEKHLQKRRKSTLKQMRMGGRYACFAFLSSLSSRDLLTCCSCATELLRRTSSSQSDLVLGHDQPPHASSPLWYLSQPWILLYFISPNSGNKNK